MPRPAPKPKTGIFLHVPPANDNAADWEAFLADEDLRAVGAKSALSSKFRSMTEVELDAYIYQVHVWQTWAFNVLKTYPFPNDHQRQIWALYANAIPTRKIPALVAETATGKQTRRRKDKRFTSDGRPGSYRRIMEIVARIKAAYPDRPPNPWDKAETAGSDLQMPRAPARQFTAEERADLETQRTPPSKPRKCLTRAEIYEIYAREDRSNYQPRHEIWNK